MLFFSGMKEQEKKNTWARKWLLEQQTQTVLQLLLIPKKI